MRDLSVDGRAILSLILQKQGVGSELDSCGAGQGPVVGPCEHGNEHSGSKKDGEFLD
jgi:hypothetical protein